MPAFPNRCQHLKVNGTQCGSPALRRNRFCYFHKRHQEEVIKLKRDNARRAVNFVLPVLEDANSIQIALMQIMGLLVRGQIDSKTASLLLYSLQIAATNLRHTDFSPYINNIVLDPKTVAETPLNSHIWEESDFETEEEEQEEEEEKEEQEVSVEQAARAVLIGPSGRAARHTETDIVKAIIDGYARGVRRHQRAEDERERREEERLEQEGSPPI
jgi:hypothetical protein